jgi:glycosyltransferase involved in cell wall biosynthesis
VRQAELSYAVVTPARNEATNLARLAGCMLEQTQRAETWAIVDDGSTDGTAEIAAGLARDHSWIRFTQAPAGDAAEALSAGRRGGRVVRSFNTGLALLEGEPGVVVKVDADVSMEPDYFERLLAEFANDPELGMASGTCYELEGGIWTPKHVTRGHVRGATRAYRWACLQDAGPLEERLGWDGIDEIRASLAGWRTTSFGHLAFRHHRWMGERDGSSRTAWEGQGDVAHFLGYRFSYLLLRTLFHARRDRAALALLHGYMRGVVRRQARYSDHAVRAHLRRQQRARQLLPRAREALGRRFA